MTLNDDPYEDSAQVAARDRMESAKRLQRDQQVDDFKWLMAHKQGRRVMWRLLEMTGLFRNPHAFGQHAQDTAFNCGMQNVGQQLLAEIHLLCPDQYHRMVDEAQKEAKKHGVTN